jgi:hypothetical protein
MLGVSWKSIGLVDAEAPLFRQTATLGGYAASVIKNQRFPDYRGKPFAVF